MYLLAGGVAALLAYLINRYLVYRFGAETIIFLTPILEEGLKTGMALLFRTAILPVHIIFGIIEGYYDLKTSRLGITAGILSIVWHTTFGLVTTFLPKIMGHLAYGVIGAILLHYLGNSVVINQKEDKR